MQLKPLVDADFPSPALVVFPSWEKLLEEDDEQTQIGIQQLLVDVVAWATGEDLCSFEEVLEYSDSYTDQFLESVDRSKLFIAPGGAIAAPLREALAEYETHVRTWRSTEWMLWVKDISV